MVKSCEAAAGVRDASVYYIDERRRKKIERDAKPLKCMKRLWKELQAISLPDHESQSIWIRYDEETPQYMVALMTGHLDTPYSRGLFCFDIYIPNDYPNSPPKVKIVTGRGKARFGPNMYANGKVCLSILGTWPGPQWEPSSSNLYQVLISIQTYLLGAQQPWYLEPGFGGWEERVKANESDNTTITRTYRRSGKTAECKLPPKVVAYNNGLRCRTMLFAILDPFQRRGPYSHEHVAPIVELHLTRNKQALGAQISAWGQDIELRQGKTCREESRFMQSVAKTIIPVLCEACGVDELIMESKDDQSDPTTLLCDSSETDPNAIARSTSEEEEDSPKRTALSRLMSSLSWRKRHEDVAEQPCLGEAVAL